MLLVSGRNGYSGARTAQSLAAGGLQGPMRAMGEFEYIYGLVAPMLWYGPMARRHMATYGTTSEQFGEVSVAMRKHASMQGNAQMKDPITLEDHQNSPMLADPFRLLDCCLQTGRRGGVRDHPRRPGEGPAQQAGLHQRLRRGPPRLAELDYPAPRHDHLRHRQARAPRPSAWRGSGRRTSTWRKSTTASPSPSSTSSRDLGFCKKGEGGGFVEGGRIQIGGDLPINTHGGLLSQGHIMGMNHVIEGAKQIRGSSDVQVEGAQHCLVSGYGDFGDGALAIFRGN